MRQRPNYPDKQLGSQRHPLSEAFSGVDVLRNEFGPKAEAMPEAQPHKDQGACPGSRADASSPQAVSTEGFDPARFRDQLNRLRDSQAVPSGAGTVAVSLDALCAVLLGGHDLLELTERVANIDYYEGNCEVLLDELAAAIAMEARQSGDREAGLRPEDDSAGPQDIAQGPSQ